MDVGQISAAQPSASLAGAIAGNQKLGQQQFLNLLITQLTHQDPLNPQEDKEFVAQMAQFSSLEGMTSLNATMGKLQSAAMLGKTVDAQVVTDGLPSSITGKVSALAFRSDGVHLTVNGRDLTMDQVVNVREQ